MKIGFTGTRHGMTSEQMGAFSQFMSEVFPLTEFHHGDCVGADDEAANIMSDIRSNSDMDARRWKIVCHPPADETHRAFNEHYDEMREPKTHFARNRAIVDECDMLIAAPQYAEPITQTTRGGTAYTVTYARKKGKKVYVIRPDGTIEGQ